MILDCLRAVDAVLSDPDISVKKREAARGMRRVLKDMLIDA